MQAEEIAEGEKLYSGNNNKTRAGWGNSYIVKIGDVINLTKAQIDKIYTAMGFKKVGGAANPAQAPGNQQNVDKGVQTPPSNGVNEAAAKQDYDSIKVNVSVEQLDRNRRVGHFVRNCNKGYKIAEKILAINDKIGFLAGKEQIQEMKDALSLITKYNVLYVLEKIPNLVEMINDVDALGFGLNKEDVIKYLLTPLVQKADEYGVTYNNMPIGKSGYLKEAAGFSLDKIKEEVARLSNSCREKEMSLVHEEQRKAQESFDKANATFAEAANMKPKPEITKNSDGTKSARLPDGRWIKVTYDKNGEINEIAISYDTAKNPTDGSDYAEVGYYHSAGSASWYSTDGNNDKYEGHIVSGFDFEKLKAVAEKIFGKNK